MAVPTVSARLTQQERPSAGCEGFPFPDVLLGKKPGSGRCPIPAPSVQGLSQLSHTFPWDYFLWGVRGVLASEPFLTIGSG